MVLFSYIFYIISLFKLLAFHELLFLHLSRRNLTTKIYSNLGHWNLFKRLMGESFSKILILVHTCQKLGRIFRAQCDIFR